MLTRTRDSEPQGTPKDLRVGDGGKSEGRSVMGRIGVEPGARTVRAGDRLHHPTRKRADFLAGSLVTRELG